MGNNSSVLPALIWWLSARFHSVQHVVYKPHQFLWVKYLRNAQLSLTEGKTCPWLPPRKESKDSDSTQSRDTVTSSYFQWKFLNKLPAAYMSCQLFVQLWKILFSGGIFCLVVKCIETDVCSMLTQEPCWRIQVTSSLQRGSTLAIYWTVCRGLRLMN